MSKQIKLRGIHAKGSSQFTIVDDDVYEELIQYAWKAKPNGSNNNVYAVRNTQVNGRSKTIRMHRVVLGYYGALDVDHINRNSLDNRKENLRVVDRSTNIKNAKTYKRHVVCIGCGKMWVVVRLGASPVPKRCNECNALNESVKKQKSQAAKAKCWLRSCALCGAAFQANSGHQKFCCDSCRYKSKYAKRKSKVLL